MVNKLTALALGAIVAFSALASAGESLYKWKDAKGEVHFTQTPPLGDIPYKKLNVTVHSVIPSPKYDLQPDKKTENTELTKETKAFKSARDRNCKQAKENMQTLALKSRIRVQQEDGSFRMLTDKEKVEKVKLSQEQIKAFCVAEK